MTVFVKLSSVLETVLKPKKLTAVADKRATLLKNIPTLHA